MTFVIFTIICIHFVMIWKSDVRCAVKWVSMDTRSMHITERTKKPDDSFFRRIWKLAANFAK